MASSSSTAMTPVEFAGRRDDAGDSGGGGQLVLDEEYADDSYDYGDYGEGEGGGGGLYGDDSGLMDPSTGLPMPAGADGNKGRQIIWHNDTALLLCFTKNLLCYEIQKG